MLAIGPDTEVHALDRLKRLSMGRDLPDASAAARYARTTRHFEDMRRAQEQLAAAVASIAGKSEERAVASLFSPGGTHAMKGEFAGMNDFEVQAYLVVLPGTGTGGVAVVGVAAEADVPAAMT
jgi:hypothetical protein